MKRILHKRQLQVISLLFAVILILSGGVAYTVSTRRGDALGVVAPAPTMHNMFRDARPSANENILFETNFGGSGNDIPTATFVKNGEIYVFGNTDSTDKDFAANEGGLRGFGARLSEEGKTLAFVIFDFSVFKVIPTQSGFAVAGNEGSVAGLYLLSDTLTLTGKAVMPPNHVLSACGLYVYDNRYFLLASSHDEMTDKDTLLLRIYTMGLSYEREKVFSHTYGLKLLDLMPYDDGYILAAAATFQDLGYLTVARFSAISPPAFNDFNLGYKYTPTAFMPLGDGYAAVYDYEGSCQLLTLSGKLTKKDIKFLSEQPNSGSKHLFYASAPYVYTGKELLYLSDEARVIGKYDWSVASINAFSGNGVCAVISGVADDKLHLGKINGNNTEFFSLDVLPQSVYIGTQSDYAVIAADSSCKSADCADNFGNADVWIAKIKL